MKHPLDLHRGRAGRAGTWRNAAGVRRARRRPRSCEWGGAVLLAIAAGVALNLLPGAGGDGAPRSDIARSATTVDGTRAGAPEPHGARTAFGLCHRGGGTNCVVDGDSFWMNGERIRISDIDTPETHPARCVREAQMGAAATRRLRQLLNSGSVALIPIDRDEDRHGRKLREVEAGGIRVGETLIAEGLARPYRGGRRAGWCD